MKLCYIWVERFKSLSNYSVNLSSKLEFSFDYERNQMNFINKKPFPKEIFGDEVSDLTALIGINGSGKTLTLELICRCMKETFRIRSAMIIVYEKNNNLYLYTNRPGIINKTEGMNIVYNDDDIKKIRMIFFSNVYDGNYLDFDNEIIDISVNSKMNPRKIYKDSFLSFESDIEKQIRFLRSPAKSNVELAVPKNIEFKLNRSVKDILKAGERKRLIRRKNDEYNEPSSELITFLQGVFLKDIKRLARRDYFSLSVTLTQQHFISTLINPIVSVRYDPKVFAGFILNNIEKITSTLCVLEVLNSELRLIGEEIWFSEYHRVDEIIYDVLLNLEHFFSRCDFSADDTLSGSKIIFTLSYDEHSNWYHQKLVAIYETVLGCSASWSRMSSGQKAYLNIFSLIWADLERLTCSEDGNNWILCIDEGDLYLHPQWQITFVETLIKCLPKISKGSLQIILTTHSPLLISDIPKQCINFLEKNGVSDFENPMILNTFGANIYDIYSQAFGLKNNRTSSISSAYISKVLKIMKKESLSSVDLEELNGAVDIIGDELILHHIKMRLSNHD